MKNRITIWGEEDELGKVFLGLELLVVENKVRIYIFPQESITEDFVESMDKKWRNGEKIEFSAAQTIERDLTINGHILPENIKVKRPEIISRAQTEWHFTVLSSKLSKIYSDELAELKEKIEKIEEYNAGLWNELKAFWSKVQDQIQDNNIVRSHANELRSESNQLFTKLKGLRKKLDEQYKSTSKESARIINEKLVDIEKRISEGAVLKPLFDELRDLQNKFKSESLTRDDRNHLWNKIDKAFKTIKAKRYGDKKEGGRGQVSRLEQRYKGLLGAINKMQSSLGRDRGDLNFQDRRIKDTDGQLEVQLRQAKKMMIEERIKSKTIKLDDMLATQKQLEAKIEAENKRAEKRKEKEEIEKVKKALHKEVHEKIITDQDARADDKAIQRAAEKLAEGKSTVEIAAAKIEQHVDEVVDRIEDIFEDAVDTVKAITHILTSTSMSDEEE